MTRADKRLRRLQEHDRWLKWTGRRCIACGQALDDDDYGGDNPREPRVCIDCCGVEGVIVDVPPGQQVPPE
jgi:hypothetical protein